MCIAFMELKASSDGLVHLNCPPWWFSICLLLVCFSIFTTVNFYKLEIENQECICMYPRVYVCFTWRSKSATFCFTSGHFLPISYHADELDELQSHRHHDRFTEVVYGTNDLVVTSKQGFHQPGLVF